FEVAIDITDRKNFERQKADFYAMITHDLKSPLTAIIGYQELIRHRLKDSDDRDLLEMSMAVERSADKLMNMVGDFLAISHYESGKLKLLKGTVDVGRILHDVAGEFSVTARRAGQELELDISGDLPDIIADGRLIDRALHNLLSNAVSYTPRGGRITLGARRLTEGDGVLLEISVSDTGPGIAPADRDKLFEKYYRASKSAGIKGAGLGLAIVKAVADAHGGRVELDTEEGKGSTFRIIIPADRERRAGNLEESAA
ncbi:MAG TPA: HAMP domain-containing sensor histidine kinase, partial [Nitrospirota bacterium]